MSTKATTETIGRSEQTETTAGIESWQAGVAAGILGAVAFGGLMALVAPPMLTAAIPAMYGLSGGAAGMFVHLSHGAVLGVAFAAILRARPDFGNTVTRATVSGAVYGAAVWVVLAALVMPIWLSAVGFAGAPPFPSFDATSLVGHLVFGVVLGAAYSMLRR